MLSTCNVRLIVTEPRLLEKVREAIRESTVQPEIYTLVDQDLENDIERPWTELIKHGEEDWITLSEQEAKETIATYFSTSGTTGPPKYAAVSHAYFTTVASNITVEAKRKPYQIKRLISLPLMHAFAAPLVLGAALRCGSPTYLMARFEPTTFLDAIARFGITEIPVVPSMLSALLADATFDARKLYSLREVMSAGAPLSRSLALRFESFLPIEARLIQLYGQTEAGWIAWVPYAAKLPSPKTPTPLLRPTVSIEFSDTESEASLSSADGKETQQTSTASSLGAIDLSPPTIGVALPGYSLALWDPENGSVIKTPQTRGEILIDAPSPFLHYLGAPKATAQTFIEIEDPDSFGSRHRRYMRSGDIAYFDASGNYYIVDRLKEMVKVRGWQVSPAELEGVLLHHPGVADAAVVGLPDEVGVSGELPHAFVVRAENSPEGASLTEHDLKRWIRDRLAAYKALASVRFVEEVPRNPAGKILRRKLVETTSFMAHNGLSSIAGPGKSFWPGWLRALGSTMIRLFLAVLLVPWRAWQHA